MGYQVHGIQIYIHTLHYTMFGSAGKLKKHPPKSLFYNPTYNLK